MSKSFDPYHKWLGIRDPERPPNHYRLLGVEMFESNIDVITTAADRQMAHLRTYRHGKNYELSERLLNEVSAAKVYLLDTDKKAAYDLGLRAAFTPDAPPAPPRESGGPEITLADGETGTRQGRATKRRWPSHYVSTIVLVASLVLLVVVLFIQFGPFSGDGTASLDTPSDPAVTVTSDDGAPADEPPSDEPPPDEPDDPTPDVVEVETTDVERKPTRDVGDAPWGSQIEDSLKRPEFLATQPSSAVLRAISLRDLESAREMLDSMQEDQPLRNRDQVDQLGLVLYTIDRFWNAFDEALLSAKQGDTVMYRHQPTSIASIGFPTQIELKSSDGQRKTFGLRRTTVDRDLAIGLVEQRFASSPATAWRLIGLFLSVDRRGGDVDEGRDYIARAEVHGFEGAYLLQVIEDLSDQSDRRVVTVPVDTSDDVADDAGNEGKIPIPPKDEYDNKKREFKTLEQIASRWVETARQTEGDEVGRYVLLAEAARMALAEGDLETGMSALDLLNERYAVEVWNLRYDLIQKMIRKRGSDRRRLANRALQLSHQAVMEDNYDQADRFIELAINIARSTRDAFFRDRLVRTRQRVKQIAGSYSDTRTAAEALKKGSDDSAASAQVGKFLCFAKGDFAGGLPLLRNGQDAAMRKLATRDLASPTGGDDQVQLGDDWQHYAESLQGLYQLHAMERARHWYEKSLRWLRGEPARAVKDKLNAIAIVVGQTERILDATRLYPVEVTVGYGKFGVNENPNLNDPTVRALPEIDGRKISRYLWTHAPSKVEYEVPVGAKAFSATGVFNADSADGAQFVVLVDGQQVYSSRALKSVGQTVEINAKLPRNAGRIVLQVKSISTYKGDQTYWVDPVFVF